MIRNSQKVAALKALDKYGRRLFISRFLEKPIQVMKERLQDVIANLTTRDSLKYYIDSAHDTQIVNMLLLIQAMNYDFVDQPYASTFYLELHYDDECIKAANDSSCFTVEIYSNGKALKLDTCLAANRAKGSSSPICQFDDFMNHLDQRRLKG